MECWQCGATVRADARFCNQCGARQSGETAAKVTPSSVEPVSSETSETGEEREQAQEQNPAASQPYAKRPPRAVRSAPEEEAEDASRPAVPSTSLLSLDEESAPPPDRHVARDTTESADEAASLPPPDASPHVAEETGQTGWDEQETMEYSVVASGTDTQADANMPPLVTLERAAQAQSELFPPEREVPPDGLPWPLVPSIIVGGRYRVEEVVATAEDHLKDENVYRVHDLQGYERCWSCGTEHGQDEASDQFCAQCGADMLARDFLMYERQEAPVAGEESVSTEEAPAGTEVEAEAEAGADERRFAQGVRRYRVVPIVPEPEPFPQGLRLAIAGRTDVGATRTGEHNEDNFGFAQMTLSLENRLHTLGIALVADGLGGHQNGQEASNLVVRAVLGSMLASISQTIPSGEPAITSADALEKMLMRAFRESIHRANEALMADNAREGTDRGSTIVAALIFGSTAYVAYVGDSRGYVLDENGLRRLTSDHSLVEQLIAGGMVAPDERYTHPQRNQIYRSLGDESGGQVDLVVQKLRPGMRLLLCSDGLWEMVRDNAIEEILRSTENLALACETLVARANENGGEDNITAVILEAAE